MFWTGVSPTYVHEAIKSSSITSEVNQHSCHCVFGRHAPHREVHSRINSDQRHCKFSLTASGVHYKSEQASFYPITTNVISGNKYRLSGNVSLITSGDGIKNNISMSTTFSQEVTPTGQSQTWYPTLLEMSVCAPLLLPRLSSFKEMHIRSS